MKNINILLALSVFSFLQSSFDAWVIRQSVSNSHTVIRQSTDAFNEFSRCDLSCMSGGSSRSESTSNADTDQTNSVTGILQMVCTCPGCTVAPDAIDLHPTVPVQQEALPSMLKESAQPFEAPGMLAGLILES